MSKSNDNPKKNVNQRTDDDLSTAPKITVHHNNYLRSIMSESPLEVSWGGMTLGASVDRLINILNANLSVTNIDELVNSPIIYDNLSSLLVSVSRQLENLLIKTANAGDKTLADSLYILKIVAEVLSKYLQVDSVFVILPQGDYIIRNRRVELELTGSRIRKIINKNSYQTADEPMVSIIREINDLLNIIDIVISTLNQLNNNGSFVLTGKDLTPKTLLEDFAPYVNAMSEILKVLSEIGGTQFKQPLIESIVSGSAYFSIVDIFGVLKPIAKYLRFGGIQVDGMVANNDFQRLKNEHQALDNQIAALELETSRSQYIINNDPSLIDMERKAKQEQILAERKQKRLDLRSKELDIEERELAIIERKLVIAQKMASDFLNPHFPSNMPIQERAEYVVRLIPHLETILNSTLILEVIPPSTLPEETNDDK